jgi:anthranilate phosphoribosyltransferase
MRLEILLKKKGIGPEGSKSLNKEECIHVFQLLIDPNENRTTQATFLVALFSLKANTFEEELIQQLQSSLQLLPKSLQFIVDEQYSNTIEQHILKNIKGHSLTYQEAYETFNQLIHQHTETPYLLAAYLEAQRLKKESPEENQAFFDWMYAHTTRIQTELPILVDLADNYDGYARYANTTLMVAAIVATYGIPCVLHSSDSIAPKFGTSTAHVIQSLGGNTNKSLEDVAQQIQNNQIKWGFIHQKNFHPAIYHLAQIRKDMVKRPCLATFEKFCQPIRAEQGNSIYGGFTHAHFKNEIPNQLKKQNKIKEAFIIKGLEGSTALPTTRSTVCMHIKEHVIEETTIEPTSYLHTYQAQPMTQTLPLDEIISKSIVALRGEKNELYYQICTQAAFIIQNHSSCNAAEAMRVCEALIHNQSAYETLKRGL